MKKILAVISLVSILILTSCGNDNKKAGAEASSEDTNVVKVGVLMPNSGDAVHAGSRQREGIEFYINNYNEAGGIKSLDGAKIQMVLADTTSKPDVGVTEIERLIEQEKVSCVIGPYQSTVGAATSPIAEKYKTPYVLTNSVADDILKKDYKYVFRVNHNQSNNVVAIVESAMGLGERAGKKPETFAIIAENTDWGKGTQSGLEEYITNEYPECEIVLSESYEANISDMSSIINKLKAADPDIIIPCCYINDALLFTRQMADYQLNNTIVSSGSGFVVGDYIEKAGENGEYISGSAAWTEGLLPYLGEEAEKLNDDFKEFSGYVFDEFSANGYVSAGVLVDAIERAGSTDKEAIQKALIETDIKEDDPIVALHPYKGVKFGEIYGMTNQNIYSDVVMVQVLDGEFKVFYPFDLVGEDNPVVYPTPPWSER